MFSEVNKIKLMGTEKKLSAVPFEDFLVFLFQSATTTPTSQLSSSSQPKDFARRARKDSSIYSIFNDDALGSDNKSAATISRRYSCPDILASETDLCSSLDSSLGIPEDDNNDSQIGDEDDLVSTCPTPAELYSRETSLEGGMDNGTDPELSPSESAELLQLPRAKWRSDRASTEHDLSFYKNFSACSRTKSSCLSSSWSPAKANEERGSSQSIRSYNSNDLTRRFTRSVPTKLNKMSRLRSMKSYYEDEYSNGKTRPPLSFDKVEKSRIIDLTLSDESATMSLFLDAVHLNQQVDSSSPSFGILYHY